MTAKFFFSPPKNQPQAAPSGPNSGPPSGPTADQQVELLYWGTVKDSTNPAVVRSYLEKYPVGSFAPLARALIEQFEKQGQADLATRLGEQKRIEAEQRALDEARHAADLKRLTEAHKAELAKQAAERAQPGRTLSDDERLRLTEQLKRDDERRATDLQKAETEAKLAKEAAAAAETQRVAALKLAEDSKRAADNARKAKEAEETRAAEKAKLAAMTKTEPLQKSSSFDGKWTINWTSGATCNSGGQTGTFEILVADDKIGGDRASGRAAASGSFRWTIQSREVSGTTVRYEGSFSGSRGSGSFSRSNNNCTGTFVARRG